MIIAYGIGGRVVASFYRITILVITLTESVIIQISSIDLGLTTVSDVNSIKQRYTINFRGSVRVRATSLPDVVLMDDPNNLQDNVRDIAVLAQQDEASAVKLDAMLARNGALPEETSIMLMLGFCAMAMLVGVVPAF